MWRACVSSMLLLAFPVVSEADGPHILGALRPETTFAIRVAASGAASRLTAGSCRLVFDDFGVPADLDRFARLRFIEDARAPQCHARTLAFTSPGGYVIHLCAAFTERFFTDRTYVEIVLIHELLHSLGLSENPPTSEQITMRVQQRCHAPR